MLVRCDPKAFETIPVSLLWYPFSDAGGYGIVILPLELIVQ